MSSFDLNFSSDKRSFAIRVTHVATVRRAAIPFSCLSGPLFLITTTDQAAIACIHNLLCKGRLDASGETHRALLIEANESRWLLYGVQAPEAQHVCFNARVLVHFASADQQRQQLAMRARKDGEAQFLTQRKRRAVDLFSKDADKEKGKRRVLSQSQRIQDTSEAPATSSSGPSSTAQRADAASSRKASSDQTKSKSKAKQETAPETPQERRAKEKLKRIILTSLRAQGVDKGHLQFADLYQHTLQAGSFALRQWDVSNEIAWERKAIDVVEDLLCMFR
jgi:hypothetical protein